MVLSVQSARLPARAALEAGVGAALGGRVRIIAREPSEWVSTYPAEVVTCQLPEGSLLRLLCKYSGGRPKAADHRSGVAYEAAVYRQVLHPLGVSVPKYLGSYRDPSTGWTTLLLEQMDEAYPVEMAQDRMCEAAAWLGRFHAAAAARLRMRRGLDGASPFAPAVFRGRRYDLKYYQQWAHRTIRCTAPLSRQYPWVAPLCRRVREPFEVLLCRPQTVVHGEFTVSNVLVCGNSICPVDWESAAIGPGEIDLLSLIEGWPQETMQQCVSAYRAARWPQSEAPANFDRALDAAYIHLLLRGLGGDPKYTTAERTRWRFDELWLAGKRWRLI